MKALLLLLLASGSAAAQVPQIGRLFTTPAERYQLDQMRQRGANAEPVSAEARAAAQASQAAAAPAPPPPAVTVSGLVRRSSGANTVWIDGEARPSGANGYVVRTPDGREITVKPGQQYDPASGSVRDAPGR